MSGGKLSAETGTHSAELSRVAVAKRMGVTGVFRFEVF
jgi:hypothetical protein